MSERLVARDYNNQVYSCGLISDVTYRFFENGYLLSTSMYCDDLARWIPIQLSWIRGLSEKYYTSHFTTLFQQFIIPDLTPDERETLSRQVVDFSEAQRIGFLNAFKTVFKQKDDVVVLKHLKGCHQHYRAGVTRLKRNRQIVAAEEEVSLLILLKQV